MNADLVKRLRQMDDLRRDHQRVLGTLNEANKELDALNVDDLNLNHQNIDLASSVARV